MRLTAAHIPGAAGGAGGRGGHIVDAVDLDLHGPGREFAGIDRASALLVFDDAVEVLRHLALRQGNGGRAAGVSGGVDIAGSTYSHFFLDS